MKLFLVLIGATGKEGLLRMPSLLLRNDFEQAYNDSKELTYSKWPINSGYTNHFYDVMQVKDRGFLDRLKDLD